MPPCPTKSEVKRYLDIWNNNEKFHVPEKALTKLFKDYPTNTDLEVVLIKMYALNDAYRTSVYWPIDVAKNILEMPIDGDLSKGSHSAVTNIARKKGKQKFEFHTNGRTIKREFYSFATKYCSFHEPDKYPLFDSNVKRALIYFKQNCENFIFNNADLTEYNKFVGIIQKFQETFDLQDVSFRDIDKYLYLVGRELNKNLPRNGQ
ncbi:MAG TPA: hypothetical protein VJJ55_02285 [Candidatus Paceibacterota bacterium]